MRGYGRVPLYTEPISTLDMTTPQMAENIEQIYEQIIADLTLAEQQLEVNKVFGRVDKVAAQALLAKVYLNMASGKHYGAPGYTDFSIDTDATYELAANWAKKVVNDYKQYYDFDDDLLHIYDVNYPDGPEHIFIMATDRSGTDEGMYTKIPLQFLPNNGSVPLYIKYGDGTLKRGNGNGWGVFIIEDDFMNSFDLTDKRRSELMHHTFYDENGEEINVAENNGYYSAKYVDPDFIGERTSARPYLIRYSDIALVLAEAEGPTTEAYELVNFIRRRAGITDLAPGLDLESFRKEVIKERAKELAFEGNRLYDPCTGCDLHQSAPERHNADHRYAKRDCFFGRIQSGICNILHFPVKSSEYDPRKDHPGPQIIQHSLSHSPLSHIYSSTILKGAGPVSRTAS